MNSPRSLSEIIGDIKFKVNLKTQVENLEESGRRIVTFMEVDGVVGMMGSKAAVDLIKENPQMTVTTFMGQLLKRQGGEGVNFSITETVTRVW